MKKGFRKAIALSVCLAVGAMAPNVTIAADKTSKYRVYQDNQLLMEFFDLAKAQSYASQFSDSHVERIGTREWVWDNYPRYRLYQYDVTLPQWEFATLDQAIKEARNWGHTSIRDIHTGGWVWDNYPRYRLYQGEKTLDNWEFATLDEAKREAQNWGNAHIIDLSTNEWIWDNISDAAKNEQRANPPVYQVYQNKYTQDDWKFPYLQDAVNEALKWTNSVVVRIDSGETVYSNKEAYQVYQNSSMLSAYINRDNAIQEAKKWAHATVVYNEHTIWSNFPYYRVYQNEAMIGDFNTIPEALQYALQYSNSSIRTLNGTVIWDNFRKLQVWGWNGISDAGKIKAQVSGTIGLDADSPAWFSLADAAGNLADASNSETVNYMKEHSIALYPLVSNQFDSALTTKFLASGAARQHFIQSLVERCSELGVDGINIDFESVSGKDRANFTTFMQELVDYAHQKEMTVSVDLPRGELSWNAKTAFDHEKLAGIADYIVTMAYDQYYQGSTSAGSVSGLPWAEKGIQDFLSYGIPRDKLILGIPFYVREWKMDSEGKLVSSRAVYFKDMPALISAKKPKMTWDEQFQQFRGEYEENGFTYVFWLEDQKTVNERIALAKKYDLAGVAAWRLGFDNAELWKQVIQLK